MIKIEYRISACTTEERFPAHRRFFRRFGQSAARRLKVIPVIRSDSLGAAYYHPDS